jgi:2-polyprenyl-3-methyl-5-hydroxy-6-metoxy-1,4-benzoquinol methylase
MIAIPAWLADLGLRVNRRYYQQLLDSIYIKSTGVPSWFDHRIDLYYQWPHNLFWLERGFFARRHMFHDCRVLDLFCGDGFYSKHFYASIARSIDAVDKDPKAIAHASRIHADARITFSQRNAIAEGFPKGEYDVIAWFEAIEHLSETECTTLMGHIKSAVGATGILVGSTPLVGEEKKGKGNWEHQNEFSNPKELEGKLKKHFVDVCIEVTEYPELNSAPRSTAYFSARIPR